jgi:rSAM/selenodomain-associated transferase 2
VLNEATAIEALLEDLRSIPLPIEVIVVDGGSSDGTPRVAAAAGARVLASPPGRGEQLRRGAQLARASLLCFIHADVRLDRSAEEALRALVLSGAGGASVFRLRIAAEGFAFRVLEAGAQLRSRRLGLPYGDQGLIVTRDLYERAGGYPAIPLMEDVALARSLRRLTDLRILDASLTVSARRWKREGVVRRTLGNWSLLARFLLGADPHRLAAEYLPEQPLG